MFGSALASSSPRIVAFHQPPSTLLKPVQHKQISVPQRVAPTTSLLKKPFQKSSSLLTLVDPLHRPKLETMTQLFGHRGGPGGGYDFRKDTEVYLHLAAREAGIEPVRPEHLLIVLLENYNIEAFKKLGITADALREELGLAGPLRSSQISMSERIKLLGKDINALEFSDELDEFLSALSLSVGNIPITVDHLANGLFRHLGSESSTRLQHIVHGAMERGPFSDEAIKRAIHDGMQRAAKKDQLPSNYESPMGEDPKRPINDKLVGTPRSEEAEKAVAAWRAEQENRPPSPMIDKLAAGNDLTELAANNELPEVFGRESEMKELSLSLQYWKKGSAIIVGPPGSGKTALVEGLAKKIVEGEIDSLRGYRLVSISIGSMMSGTQYRGMLEKNIQDLISEAKNRKTIVFIDEIHGAIGAGATKESSTNIGDLIKEARGVKWIGATTDKEYTEIFNKDKALDRRFERIDLSPPNLETKRVILEGVRPSLEKHYNITYTNSSITAAINHCDRYVGGHSPDKEITVLDRAGAISKDGGKNEVDAEQVALAVEKKTKIPLTRLLNETGKKVSGAEMIDAIKRSIRQYVVGQDRAVEAVARAIFQSRMGVNPDLPVVMVFAGPTGTGKTELVKAIERIDGRKLIEVNLESIDHASSLIGAEPSFVGHGKEGRLTGPQKLNPHSVVLLDEMDKTNKEVIQSLMSPMDNGYVYDSTGEKVSFKNSIIIFTTNYGASYRDPKSSFGFNVNHQSNEESYENRVEEVKQHLRDKLGPEVIGRLTNFILFDILKYEDLIDVTAIKLRNIARDFYNSKSIDVYYGERLISTIAELGLDPKSGGRAPRRIANEIVREAVGFAIAEWPELDNFEKLDSLMLELIDRDLLEITYKGERLTFPVNLS